MEIQENIFGLIKLWSNSLGMLLPQSLKLYVLISLNAFIKGGAALVKHLWWFLGFVIALQYFDSCNAIFHYCSHKHFVGWLAIQFILSLFGLCVFLSIRPSLKLKSFKYFLHYLPHISRFFVLTVIPLDLVVWAMAVYERSYGYVFSKTSELFFSFVILCFFVPIVSFMSYFMLDSNGSWTSAIKSIIQGLKMAFYNLPFVFISMVFFLIVCAVFALLFAKIFPDYELPLLIGSWFYFMVLGSWFNTLYIKKAYEDYTWYF